jgi:hypothetical protein
MATVELHIVTMLLPYFDSVQGQIDGHVVSHRAHPETPTVTILNMQMQNAPAQAIRMEPIFRTENGKVLLEEIHYWDKHGIFLAPVVPFPKAVTG